MLPTPTASNITNPTLSLLNSSNAIAGLMMASTGSSIVLNVPSNDQKSNLSTIQSSTATTGQLLPSNTNSIDDNSVKFIQEAKSINDQLNSLYQHLLLKKQSLLKAEAEVKTKKS